MTLTRDELRELSGKTRPDAIMRWLDQERIAYLRGGDGWPKVSRIVIEIRLGAVQSRPIGKLHLEGIA